MSTKTRGKKIGNLGEGIIPELLKATDFTEIVDLNMVQNNYPFVDFQARRNGRVYRISVKTRNRYQQNGAVNPSFNLVKKKHHAAGDIEKMEAEYGAEFAWVAIQIEPQAGVFSAYFGTWTQIGRTRLSIPMLPKDTGAYECLALRQSCQGIDPSLDNRFLV
jgi:hypothetical protein